jgi:hypothetical protein
MFAMKKVLGIFVLVLIVVTIVSVKVSFANPSISSVSGKFENGGTITINGNGFGLDGPHIVVFEDFDDKATAGSLIDLKPTSGKWDGYQSVYYNPVYNEISRSGSFSGEFSAISNHVADSYREAGFFVDFSPCTEFFLSYAVQVPPETFFPQKYSSAPVGEFPHESAWKFAWIRDYENDPDASPGDDDKCLPTYIGSLLLTTDGNDLNASNGASSIRIHDKEDTWWQWGSWNRFAFWGKADKGDPASVAGREWAQAIGEGVEQIIRVNNTDPLFHNGTPPYQWTRLHINGWIRPTPLEKPVHLLYDDIYFAVGPNAAARVEIGNDAEYKKCTKLAIATPVIWSDTKVSVTIRQGSFSNGDNIYLFLIDADNACSMAIGPFSFGSEVTTSSSTLTEPPHPPAEFVPEEKQ